MNEKITLPTLIQLFSQKTRDTRKDSEDFIKEFFGLISSVLEEEDQVKIKGLGTFKTVLVGARKSVNVSTGEETIIPAHKKVVFVPSKEVAERVNEPFEMFETVEVNEKTEILERPETESESVTLERADTVAFGSPASATSATSATTAISAKTNLAEQADSDNPAKPVDSAAAASLETGESEEDLEVIINPEDEFDPQNNIIILQDDVVYDSPVPPMPPDPAEEIDLSLVDDDLEALIPNYKPPKSQRKIFGMGFLSGFLSAIVVCGIVFVCWYLWSDYISNDSIDNQADQTQQEIIENKVAEATNLNDLPVNEPIDSTQQENETDEKVSTHKEGSVEVAPEKMNPVETKPSDQKVYDTITKTRYLTTMAKDHYGNFNLWPYIYMENQSFLGHPDRIKPGTKVVIPPLTKYNVDATNPEDIAKAKKLGVKIYSKYK